MTIKPQETKPSSATKPLGEVVEAVGGWLKTSAPLTTNFRGPVVPNDVHGFPTAAYPLAAKEVLTPEETQRNRVNSLFFTLVCWFSERVRCSGGPVGFSRNFRMPGFQHSSNGFGASGVGLRPSSPFVHRDLFLNV